MRQNTSAHRKSIAHIIAPLAGLLVLLVAYHAWIKPTFFPTAPDLTRQTEKPPPFDVTVPLERAREPDFMPRNRLVEVGDAPSPALGVLRDELEKGNVRQVEAGLRRLSARASAKPVLRRYLAGLWNNLGIQQERYGGTRLSVGAFTEAAKLDPHHPTILLNLTQAYWELRHPGMTPRFLDAVIRAAPDDPFPHLAYADLLLDRGAARPASTHLREAQRLAGTDPNLAAYLKKLTAKAEAAMPSAQTAENPVSPPKLTAAQEPHALRSHEIATDSPAIRPTTQATPTQVPLPEETPRRLSSPNRTRFTVQYDGQADESSGTKVRAILDYAFDEITQKFGHIPQKQIPVVLHTNLKFDGASGSPVWADRLFDRQTGAIHIPVQGAFDDLAPFSRILRHQFAHALLFEYLRGTGGAVPTWLLEGLVMHLAEDPWPGLEEAKPNAVGLAPLASLQGDWTKLPAESLLFAYMEAHSAVQSFVDRYSMYKVRQVLSLVGSGQTLDAAMLRQLSVSYEQFRRQWEQDHRSSFVTGS